MGSFGSGRPFSSLPRVQMIISCSHLQSLCQANTNTWPLSVRITVLERKNKVTYTVDLDSPICFFFLVMPRAMQDLLQPGIKPMPPALGVWILNLWTPRKVPHLYFKNRLVIANIFFFFFFLLFLRVSVSQEFSLPGVWTKVLMNSGHRAEQR